MFNKVVTKIASCILEFFLVIYFEEFWWWSNQIQFFIGEVVSESAKICTDKREVFYAALKIGTQCLFILRFVIDQGILNWIQQLTDVTVNFSCICSLCILCWTMGG